MQIIEKGVVSTTNKLIVVMDKPEKSRFQDDSAVLYKKIVGFVLKYV